MESTGDRSESTAAGAGTGAETGRRLKRVSKTSKASSSSSDEESDRAQSNGPVKSDRAQSNTDSDHPRDTSAAAIMCAAILDPRNRQLESISSRRTTILTLSTDSKTVAPTSNKPELTTSKKQETPTSKPLALSVVDSYPLPLRASQSQEYLSYALAQLQSLSSPVYRTLPSSPSPSPRQLIRVSKTNPLKPSITDTIAPIATITNVTIQNNKDGCYFLCEEFFLLKHGTGHFPHHRWPPFSCRLRYLPLLMNASRMDTLTGVSLITYHTLSIPSYPSILPFLDQHTSILPHPLDTNTTFHASSQCYQRSGRALGVRWLLLYSRYDEPTSPCPVI